MSSVLSKSVAILAILAGLTLASPDAHATTSADSRPNIVLILIDDLGWKDIGCTGSRYYQTPHIDQLFNLPQDPHEQNDLSPQMAERVQAMQAKISQWQKEADAKMPRANPKFDPEKKPSKDKLHSWENALEERETHRENLDRSENVSNK